MKIELKDITVDLFEHDISHIKNVAVNCSTGTDSTILLYLTALALPDRKIIPYCVIESQFPNQENKLLQIIDKIILKLPNRNLANPILDYADYNSYDSKWRKEAIENPGIFPKRKRGHEGQAKILANKFYQTQRIKNGEIDYFVSGITSNPPIEVLKDIGCEYEDRRSLIKEPKIYEVHYDPFVHLNKRHIAEMWKKYDMMDIFYLTESCINCPLYGDYFSKDIPCKKCYFCSEKYWAFGMYDGGIK
tara:strand:- start:1016 stop:1756 length:741 start_codon:yes stop_codon:yes gene_type:complete